MLLVTLLHSWTFTHRFPQVQFLVSTCYEEKKKLKANSVVGFPVSASLHSPELGGLIPLGSNEADHEGIAGAGRCNGVLVCFIT